MSIAARQAIGKLTWNGGSFQAGAVHPSHEELSGVHHAEGQPR